MSGSMKFNKAPIVHGILIVLVTISLIVTYFIIASPVELINWINGTFDNEEVALQNETEDTSNAQQNQDQQPSRLLLPRRLVTHNKEDKFELTTNHDLLERTKNYLQNLQYDEGADIEEIGLDTFRENCKDQRYVEVKYADEMPSALYANLPDQLTENDETMAFTAFVIFPKDDKVYLISEDQHTAYTLSLINTNDNQKLIDDIFAADDKYAVTPVNFAKGRHYIMKDKQVVPKQTYMLERQPNTFFLNALFSSPGEIHDYSDDDYSRYYSNNHQLAIDNKTYELNFNHNVDSSEDQSIQDKIKASFNKMSVFFPDQETWWFVGYESSNHTITYRKFINELPIFAPYHVSKTEIKMNGDDISNLQMSSLTIQTQLTDLSEDLELMSGTNTLEILRNNGIDTNDIEDLQIGYRWVESPDSNRLVELIPTWYVKRDGEWYALEDLVDMSDYDHLKLRYKDSGDVFPWDDYLEDTKDKPVEQEATQEEVFHNSDMETASETEED